MFADDIKLGGRIDNFPSVQSDSDITAKWTDRNCMLLKAGVSTFVWSRKDCPTLVFPGLNGVPVPSLQANRPK